MAEPWPITEKVGNSYHVQLLASVKIHPIFSPDKLHQDPNKSLSEQVPDSPPPIEVNGELEYDVDEVIAVRTQCDKLQYQMQWTEYDDDPDPSQNLDYWIECASRDEAAEK
ncbi:hypothetical protein AJ79_07941 [Helicocarpus griseus UAMH5409]|uniref:Chromo domain-containing protein n=1 Tax=Helicocarpus griseus UAMH5409 TaxID=1447875 RepID=A0A2B7WPJ9_9EURO|nr:hypothetical protein AJ79_07941 [Helicocarpus griseus UAMH5409]